MSDLFTDAYVPDFDRGETASVSRAPARPAFLLMAHPERWSVAGGKIRPDLGRMKLIAGVANVSVGVGGKLRIGGARAHYEERGWKILPIDTLPPSQAGRGSYLSQPAGRKDLTLPYWIQTFAGSTATRCDEALRDEFLDYLVDAGVVPPPPIHVLERMKDAAAQDYEKASDRAQAVPSYKSAAKAAKARLDVIAAEIEARIGATGPQTGHAVGLDEVNSEA